jgi:hypothetical protein
MAKFEEVSEETKKLFIDVHDKTNIPHWVEFEMLVNNKQKQLYRITKLNDLVETITDGINFVIVINEEIFDQLTDEQKRVALVECLAGVSVSENEAVSLEKPDFSTYRGVLQKYGHEDIITLHESVKSLFDKKKQEEDERKAAGKGKRGRRPKSE